MLIRSLSKLSPKRQRVYHSLWGLMKEFDDCGEEESADSDARVYGLTIALYPTHHKNLPSQFKKEGKEEK